MKQGEHYQRGRERGEREGRCLSLVHVNREGEGKNKRGFEGSGKGIRVSLVHVN